MPICINGSVSQLPPSLYLVLLRGRMMLFGFPYSTSCRAIVI
uniref:Uncharacterized protein n=1 Tax=Arundo donax TaxID=35708 RepID=A0A0A9EPG8_ARUDO